MKSLTIAQENIKMFKGSSSISLGDQRLDEIIINALPKDIQEYSDFIADISIHITIHEPSALSVTTTGYTHIEEDTING